ncbi:MAG: Bug family tripartite tricarboxylate transporter substrate binding protein [Burkholderiaceae bacterium]
MELPDLSRRHALQLIAGAGLAGVLGPLAAQGGFPNRPVKLVVPYPPGGSTDILARAFTDVFAQALGQPVIIDNRPGAATNIGLEIVASSPADGYTIYFGTSGMATNPHFGPKPSVDVQKAVVPISMAASMTFVVAARPSLPVNTPAELVAAARRAPNKLSISSASLETQVKTLNRRAGIELLHVPYKGGAQATADAIAGHVDMVIALLPVLLPHIQSGKLKAIGLTAPRRSAAAPNIPTFAENGIGDVDLQSWFALFAPAGTPETAIRRLNAAAVQAAKQPELNAKMISQGIEIQSSSPAELAARLRDDYADNAKLAQELR